MANDVAKLVTFGKGGDTLYLGRGSTVSGYGSPERPHAADCNGKDRVIPDGTYAVDTRPATDTDEGLSWAIRGPMVDVDLPDGGHDACGEVPGYMLGEGGLQGSFAGLAALATLDRATKKPRGCLDYVSVSEYVQGWRERGARIGRYQGGVIVWE